MVIFKAKPRKIGRSSYAITLPADYIKNGLINPKKYLVFEVKEEVRDGEGCSHSTS